MQLMKYQPRTRSHGEQYSADTCPDGFAVQVGIRGIALVLTRTRSVSHMARDLRKCTLGAKKAKMSLLFQNVPWTLLIFF